MVGALCWFLGWREFLLVQAPIVVLAGGTGVWLNYVQHQFEATYWERPGGWNYTDAALRGSSYLRLPKVLQFFTGNIGLHHIHHLNPRIPNYNLQRAQDESPVLQSVPKISLGDGLPRRAPQALGRGHRAPRDVGRGQARRAGAGSVQLTRAPVGCGRRAHVIASTRAIRR